MNRAGVPVAGFRQFLSPVIVRSASPRMLLRTIVGLGRISECGTASHSAPPWSTSDIRPAIIYFPEKGQVYIRFVTDQ